MSLQFVLKGLHDMQLRQASVSFSPGNVILGYSQAIDPADPVTCATDIRRCKKSAIHNTVRASLAESKLNDLELQDVEVVLIEGNCPIPKTLYIQLAFKTKL